MLNLDDTVAVTQNFCSKQNFAKVWRETRSGRKKMAVKWLRKLHELHPDLAATAERLNAEDGFTMPFDKKIAHDADAAGEGGRGGDSQAEEHKDGRGRSSKKDGKKEKKKSTSKSRSRSKSRGGAAESNQPASTSSSKSPVVFEKNSDGRKKHESSRDNYTTLPHGGLPNADSTSDSSMDRVRLTCTDSSVGSSAAPCDTAKSESLSTTGQSGAGSRPTSESSGEGSGMSRVSSGVGSSSGGSSGGSSCEDEEGCGVDGDKGQKRKIEAVTGALAGMMAAAGTTTTGAVSK